MGFIPAQVSSGLTPEDKIDYLAVAYVSSRKDADKMSVKEFYDAYIKTVAEMKELHNQSR